MSGDMDEPTAVEFLVPAPRATDARGHVVQFYRTEEFLLHNVASFVAEGLRGGESVIVIATREHLSACEDRLARDGVEVRQAIEQGSLVLRDASDTIASFSSAGRLDAARFRDVVGELIRKARAASPHRRVRAYGEM